MADRGSILVVGDDLPVRETVTDFLESSGYKVLSVSESDAIYPALNEHHFDAVVLDSLVNDGAGLELLPIIKQFDPALGVIVIAEHSGGESARNAIARGASSCLHRPLRLPALLSRIHTATTARSFYRHVNHLMAAPRRNSLQLKRHIDMMEQLLQFDNELMAIMDYRRVLEAILNGLLTMTGASVAATMLIRDKVVSAMVLPKQGARCPNRDHIFAALTKEWEAWGGHPIDRESLLWTGFEEGSAAVRDVVAAPLMVHDAVVGALAAFTTDSSMLASDAAALVPMVAGRAEIVVENAFLHEHTKILANTDALTGLLNRRVFREGIVREFERSRRLRLSKRTGGELSVMMVDVDHFKGFNDTYGHQLGDKVLKMVASVMMNIARRATDMVSRYGGEEFVIVAPDTSLENATLVAERIRQTLRETPVESSSGPLYVTASFGVSAYPACGATNVETLVEQCDEAMYRAKRNGRDRVEIAPKAEEPPVTATT